MSYKSILVALGLVAMTGCGHRSIIQRDSSADGLPEDTNVLVLDTTAEAALDYTLNDTAGDAAPAPDSTTQHDTSPDQYVNQPPIVKFLYTGGGAPGQQTWLYFSATDPESAPMTFSIKSTPSISTSWNFLGSPSYLLVRTQDTLDLSTLNSKLMIPVKFSFTATDADGKSTTVTVDRQLNRYNTGATLWCGTEQWNFAPDLDIAQKMYSGVAGFTMSPGMYKASSTTDPKGVASVASAWKGLSQGEKQRVADRSANYSTFISKMDSMTKGPCNYTHIGIEDILKK